MKLIKAAALALGLLPMAAMAPAAYATTDVFNWAITAYGTPAMGYLAAVESGTLTATENNDGSWTVDTLSLKGSTTNVLAASTSATDNLIFPQANVDITSLNTTGLTFTTPDFGVVHIFDDYQPGVAYTTPPSSGGINPYGEISSVGYGQGNFTLAGAAPEPSAWILILTGVGGAGLMLRRAKAKTAQGVAVSA